jgi:diguanylate cyclase (GGDEF)-like protein
MAAEIITLSITDSLTGLHNRRGFLTLAEQQLKLSDRTKRGMLLFFADLDDLKRINDTLGHEEGDKALIDVASVLKETFRASDIIARMGGDEFAILTDEFAILVPNAEENTPEIIINRLQNRIDTHNNQANRKYKLSISIGSSFYNPENPSSIDELMASADKLMYEQKNNKKFRPV